MEKKYLEGKADLTMVEKELPNEIKLDVRDFLDETQLEKFYESLREYLEDEYQGERCCGFNVSSITLSGMDWCEQESVYQVADGNEIVAEFDTFEKAKEYLEDYGSSEIIKETEYRDSKGKYYDTDYKKVYEKEWE